MGYIHRIDGTADSQVKFIDVLKASVLLSLLFFAAAP